MASEGAGVMGGILEAAIERDNRLEPLPAAGGDSWTSDMVSNNKTVILQSSQRMIATNTGNRLRPRIHTHEEEKKTKTMEKKFQRPPKKSRLLTWHSPTFIHTQVLVLSLNRNRGYGSNRKLILTSIACSLLVPEPRIQLIAVYIECRRQPSLLFAFDLRQ